MKKTYSELLKDPRWQKKRLEIMNRDDFTCRKCQSKEKTLHVHHVAYLAGNDPWDYHDNFYLTLCHECHETEHADAIKSLSATLSTLGFFSDDIEAFEAYVCTNPEIFNQFLKSLRAWA